jgi:hypothetical protein
MMKKLVIALSILAVASQALAVSPNVRIAQVYSGGGSSQATATYMKDYVVLFNAVNTPVNIGGWALEYGSATGNWGSSTTNYFEFPADTFIQGCSYLMVACGAAGTGGADFPVTPDFITTNISMGAANGKVAIFNALNSNLACGSELPGTLVDKMSWGTGNCAEGVAVAALTITTGADRNSGGRDDTDDNSFDFTVVTNPVPMTSATPPINCGTVPANTETWGTLKSIWR